MDNVSAKFLLDRIRIARTTYGWTDETTAGNFKLALRGKAIDWLNHIRDTLDVDISTWTNIEPEFIKHFNVKTSTIDNVWDLTKLKHEDKDIPSDLMLEVSKLINNVGATAQPFNIPIQANYTEDEVKRLVVESNKNLKNHLMKTIYINKLSPTFKEYVLAKEPKSFQEANDLAVALWRRRNPEGVSLKPKSIFAIESNFKDNIDDLTQEEREECINAIRNKRNNGQNFRQNGGFSDQFSSNNYSNTDNKQHKPKKDKKKKDSAYTTIKCWFCSKPGHTQIECRQRKAQNKPLTWRNREVKSKYHSNKIMALTDLGDIEEIKEWTQKIEAEAMLSEIPKSQDFQ